MSPLRTSSWLKNVVIVPAWWIAGGTDLLSLCGVLFAMALLSAGSYLLNEWADRHADAFHPKKKSRYWAQNPEIPFPGWLLGLLWLSGLGALAALSGRLCAVGCAFIGCAWAYNLHPLRLKNRPCLDILWESLNPPLRATVGCLAATGTLTGTWANLVCVYFLFGLSFMTFKRRWEWKVFIDPLARSSYRRSLAFYRPGFLLTSASAFLALALYTLTSQMEVYVN